MADIFNMADTWNDGATTFTAIKMNVTDTASNAASLLMDLQVGGASRFNVRKDGTLFVNTGSSAAVMELATDVDTNTALAFRRNTTSLVGYVGRISGNFGLFNASAGIGVTLGTGIGIGVGVAKSPSSILTIAAGTTGLSQMRFVQGVAPTAPVDGDVWREDNTVTGLKIRINGATYTVNVS
jgi:hypothetical protein